MKKSIYTIIEKVDDSNYIFYNTRTAFVKIYSKELYNDFLIKECNTCKLYPICLGGCSNGNLLIGLKPCIKEKYYMSELLQFVGKYMLNNNIKEYQYEIEEKKNV